uniref:Secreted protein n=1 Tax=Chenopodium quinoa TaxID=63459 RepID=A0A803LRJ3_CHEQI
MVFCLGLVLVCSLLMKGMDASNEAEAPGKEKKVAAVDGAKQWNVDLTDDPSSDENEESTETKFEGDDASDDTPRTIVMGH